MKKIWDYIIIAMIFVSMFLVGRTIENFDFVRLFWLILCLFAIFYLIKEG